MSKFDADLAQQLGEQIALDIDNAIFNAMYDHPIGYIYNVTKDGWANNLVKDFDQFWFAGQLYSPKQNVYITSHIFASKVASVGPDSVLMFLGVRQRVPTKERLNNNLDFYFLQGEKVVCLSEGQIPMKKLFTHETRKNSNST